MKTDYLIAGAGAMGMCFADTLLSESPDATMVIVDRNAAPGGHWNHAYPFVRLHQPAAAYGVPSRNLGSGKIETVGINAGFNDLASGSEVSAYFGLVMRERLLASGRVKYFPRCDYTGDGNFHSLLTGEKYHVEYKRFVNTIALTVDVPSTSPPKFSVAEGMRVIPLNDLPHVTNPSEGFVVIGGGKTGVDACLWLLENGVDPDTIQWIVSQDPWMFVRDNFQTSDEFFTDIFTVEAERWAAIADAENVEEMFFKLEECGYMARFDTSVAPKVFRGATISHGELAELRKIKRIVRMGRVTHIEPDRIVLKGGTIPTNPDVIHVHCSAGLEAIMQREINGTIFLGDTITPLSVVPFMLVFSASLAAYLEANYEDDDFKNSLCRVGAAPRTLKDFAISSLVGLMNKRAWAKEEKLLAWLSTNRLNHYNNMASQTDPADTERMALLQRVREESGRAAQNLIKLIA